MPDSGKTLVTDSRSGNHQAGQPDSGCGGFQCIGRGLHYVLGLGVLLELLAGNGIFHHGSMGGTWLLDPFAVILLMAMTYFVYWWYGVRNTSRLSAEQFGGITGGRKLQWAQGMGVMAVSLLCLTGFLGLLLESSSPVKWPGLQSENLVMHRDLLFVVWAFLVGHLFALLVRRYRPAFLLFE